ncbi:MAG TPA: histidine phosphatase family protein [Steroidobacter sp.]|uniref:histidine phosphatase family protein n=1 Tax=Steroidobacter sp. TaxID=1978227 RepID=UPI002ED9A297
MTNELILVRHARCEHMDEMLLGRTVDAPLDAQGVRQAEATASALRHRDDLLIMASPRRRARQTAAAIAALTGGEVVSSDAIDEIDFGPWSGQTFAQLAGDAGWRYWNEHRSSAATPSGERIADVQARMLRQLNRWREDFPGRVIAIVTHAEVIRAVLMHWLDAPIDGYGRLAIDPASYSTVSLGDWGVRIEGINQRVAA